MQAALHITVHVCDTYHMRTSLTKQATLASAPQGAAMSISLIGKLQSLEEIIQHMTDEMNSVYRDVQLQKSEKDALDIEISHRSHDGHELLKMELNNTEHEIHRHVSNQKAENSRLMLQINQLKNEKTDLQLQIAKLRERLQGLEKLIGEEVQAK